MSNKRLQKTSVQLPPEVFREMQTWPGLTRSEAIRLSVERALYFATLNGEAIAALASRFEPILRPALEDFGYEGYRAVARALPAIVQGFIRENPNVTWRNEALNRLELAPGELVEQLNRLTPIERIGVLDCIVASRPRPPTEYAVPDPATVRPKSKRVAKS